MVSHNSVEFFHIQVFAFFLFFYACRRHSGVFSIDYIPVFHQRVSTGFHVQLIDETAPLVEETAAIGFVADP